MQCDSLMDRFVIMDLHGADGVDLSAYNTDLVAAAASFRNQGIGTNNLKYGAGVRAEHRDDHRLRVRREPDRRDASVGNATATVKMNTLAGSDNKHYELAKAAIRDLSCFLPPSSAMAGIYAAVDDERGVWKAPANVSVAAVINPSINFTAADQGLLNVDPTARQVDQRHPRLRGQGHAGLGRADARRQRQRVRYINVRRVLHLRRGEHEEGDRAVRLRAQRRQHLGSRCRR